MLLKTDFLNFTIDENAKNAYFFITGKEDKALLGSDFFRLILDDGLRTEISVISSMQKGRAKEEDGKLVIEYDKLVSEYGDNYDIAFTVTVEEENGLLKFTPEVVNNTKNTH